MNVSKWIVVTGASSGIGRKTAQILLDKGYNVVLTARNESVMSELAGAYPHDSYEIIPWNLSDIDSLSQYAGEVNKRVGAIAGLVHCAGIQLTTPLHLINNNKLIDVFNINTFAAINLVSLFCKRKYYIEGETSFVLISSIASYEGAIGKSIYAASKGAIEGFLRPATAELMAKGIRINIVVPGMINTNMNEDYYRFLTYEQKENIERNYPLGIGDSEDVSNIITYLIGKESRWITGQKFIIDGGHLSRRI